MNVLVMGLDSQGYYAGFADVIRVARIDFTRPSIILLGIPRDLWVSIPGLAHVGINEDRLKMAYPYGNVKQVPGGGPSLMAQTLTFNMGLRVDRYAATDFATFESVIDEIGGIDIYLPEAVGNETTDPPVFPAGWNHMDGAAALRFSRVRPENSSDLERMDRQNQVISAIRARLTSSDLLPRIPALVEQVRGSIATDLSPAELSALVCVAQQVPPDDMSIVRIDKPLVLSVTDEFGHERLLPDQDGIRDFVRAFNAGDVDAMRMLVQK
jgi:LCP family protein required for cell wall assembly